jgi:hypothetical protein
MGSPSLPEVEFNLLPPRPPVEPQLVSDVREMLAIQLARTLPLLLYVRGMGASTEGNLGRARQMPHDTE